MTSLIGSPHDRAAKARLLSESPKHEVTWPEQFAMQRRLICSQLCRRQQWISFFLLFFQKTTGQYLFNSHLPFPSARCVASPDGKHLRMLETPAKPRMMRPARLQIILTSPCKYVLFFMTVETRACSWLNSKHLKAFRTFVFCSS